ncbi:MAG TPA: SPOR domain-containing protein [Legionellaceae bacterium]|nr:SPOR domain-containing protein [Legionellaceae bacterium]
MSKSLQISGLCLVILSLSACMGNGTNRDLFFWDTPNDTTPLYPETYDTSHYDNRNTQKTVVVPQSYHLSVGNPIASKDEDKQWVASQNPNGYTIQIANDSKPAPVANKLQQVPKTERSAEVKSQSGTYLGLYGSYPSREAAEAQRNLLPEHVKDQAQIKEWQSIQSEMN